MLCHVTRCEASPETQLQGGDRCPRVLRLAILELPGREQLVYGQSITDACIGWITTESLLR